MAPVSYQGEAMTNIRIAIVAASVAFAATLAGTAKAECRDFVCGLAGEIATAVQKGPHVAAQDSAANTPAASAPVAEATHRKPKRLARAVSRTKSAATSHRTKRKPQPAPNLLPASDDPPVEEVPPETVNAIDLAAGPAPSTDGEHETSADETPPGGIRNDEAARMALAMALNDKAHQLRSTPAEPPAKSQIEKSWSAKSWPAKSWPAKSWLVRAWAVVADALSAAQTAVRTLIG